MKLTNKQTVTFASATVFLVTAYIVYNKIRKKTLYNRVIKALEDVATAGGDFSDLQMNKAFDISYWKTNHNQTLITPAAADSYAKSIYSAKGTFNDDEEKVYGLFTTLQNKAQISQVAASFQKIYKITLYNFLLDMFSENEYNKVYQIILSKK